MSIEPTLPGVDDDENPRAVMGGNNPPEPMPYDVEIWEAHDKKAREFLAVSDVWKKTPITTELHAERCADQISGLSQLRKRVEDQRVAEKSPYDQRANKVQAAYAPIVKLLDESIKSLKAHVGKYAQEKEAKAEAERLKKIADAKAAEEAAAMLRMDAERSGSTAAIADAERAQNEAARGVRNAQKPADTAIRSASGAGRTLQNVETKVVEVKNIRVLLMHLQEDPDIIELARRKAQAIASASGFPKDGTIPGCEITTKTTLR